MRRTRNSLKRTKGTPFYINERPISSVIVDGYINASGESQKTGIKPVDTVVEKTISFEKKYLSDPLVQVTVLGLAAYGAYKLFTKYVK